MTGDPLHQQSGPATAWTTVNTAEALPGVLTPLGWTFWAAPCERGMRGAFSDIGVLSRKDIRYPDQVDDRYSAVFFGRYAANIDKMRGIGDLMPGTSGDAVEQQILGALRPGISSRRSFRRYPLVAVCMPTAAIRVAKILAGLRTDTDRWWRQATTTAATDPAGAPAQLADAMARYETIMRPHAVATMLAQACYEQLTKLAQAAGRPGLETRLMTGYGSMEETCMLADLWAVSRRESTLETFLASHGYHGPGEGELSNPSWREDSTALEPLLSTYATMSDDSAPQALEAGRRSEREAATAELLAALPRSRRGAAKVILKLAAHYIPLREVGKAAFLQAIDGGRAAARTLGESLATAGTLGDAEDVFYLTVDEILTGIPTDAKQLVTDRRAKRDEHLKVRLPDTWTGMPTAIPVVTEGPSVKSLTGVPVSDGIVEGLARIIHDPAADMLEPGEIMVCATTDPSWTSLFLVAAGLVIDIGGPLSHGAIVARELGIPCVINTRTGTTSLRTGDLVRVDGTTGEVTVL